MTQIELCWAIIATTTPCLKPFMSALNTHYGGPTSLKTPAGSKASIGSSSGRSKGVSKIQAVEKKVDPQTRFDGAEYNVEVDSSGDIVSFESDEAKRMIISKDTTWAIDFEEQGGCPGQAF